jgi:hypothetical protein
MDSTDKIETIVNELRVVNQNRSSLDNSQIVQPNTVQSEAAFRKIIEKKKCPICMRVPRYPASYLQPSCGHEGCESCLTEFKICGACGKGPTESTLTFKQWPQSARDAFNRDLLVKCKNCTAFKPSTLEQLLKHEEGECVNRIVQCPGCHRVGKPREITAHYKHHTEEAQNEVVEELFYTTLSDVVRNGTYGIRPELPAKLERTKRSFLDRLATPNLHMF